jgi:hypothetical protein
MVRSKVMKTVIAGLDRAADRAAGVVDQEIDTAMV